LKESGTVFAIIFGMRRMKMKKTFVLAAALILLVPSLSLADTFSLRLGYYFPAAKGGPDSLWDIEFQQMSFTKADFRGTILGFSYEHFLSKNLSLALTVDTYNKKKAGLYNDYSGITVDNEDWAFSLDDIEGDFNIAHSFNVSLTPIEASLKFLPLGRRTQLIPYVGGGAGMYLWRVNIRGSIINFDVADVFLDADDNELIGYLVEFADLEERNRISFGYHVFGGIMYPIGNRLTLEAEFRYRAVKGKFEDAFLGFEDFDLGGYTATVGFNYWF